jgi:hypothetical protein
LAELAGKTEQTGCVEQAGWQAGMAEQASRQGKVGRYEMSGRQARQNMQEKRLIRPADRAEHEGRKAGQSIQADRAEHTCRQGRAGSAV